MGWSGRAVYTSARVNASAGPPIKGMGVIKIWARSLGGSEHLLVGKVVNKETVPWDTVEEAVAHIERNGWTIITKLWIKPNGDQEVIE